MLVKHLRDDLRRPFGTIVADKFDGEIRVGVAICHSELDSFNKKLGISIAHGRAKASVGTAIPNHYVYYEADYRPMHEVVKYEIEAMFDRCDRYYKTGALDS